MKPEETIMRTVLGGMAAMLALTLTAAAQTVVPREQPLVIKSVAGADLYKFYCSTCHGADAKGHPAATPQQPAAPDLTTLARRNGGVFPRAHVIDVVRNGAGSPASHGPTGMPVWGAIFRGLEPDVTRTAIRIENLVDYLQSRQEHEVHLGR
jgi:mono/diheme cytochrome c family protein